MKGETTTSVEAYNPTKSAKNDYDKLNDKGQAIVFWAKLFTCETTDDTERMAICKLLKFNKVNNEKLMTKFRHEIARVKD